MALVIKTCGDITKVSPKNGVKFSLEELQSFVGGYIEFVPLPESVRRNAHMICNEDGRIIGLPTNVFASLIAKQDIVGDVLLCEHKLVED